MHPWHTPVIISNISMKLVSIFTQQREFKYNRKRGGPKIAQLNNIHGWTDLTDHFERLLRAT